MNSIALANENFALKSLLANATQFTTIGSALDMVEEVAHFDGFLDADGFFVQSDKDFAAEIGGMLVVLKRELETV